MPNARIPLIAYIASVASAWLSSMTNERIIDYPGMNELYISLDSFINSFMSINIYQDL